jgi:hypothetical protein
MDNFQDLTLLLDVRTKAMQAIEWRLNYEFIKFGVKDTHLILLLLEITILHTQHLVKILEKRPRIGKVTYYQ